MNAVINMGFLSIIVIIIILYFRDITVNKVINCIKIN